MTPSADAASALPSRRAEGRRSAARKRANAVIGFLGHLIVYLLGSLLLFVLAGFFAGVVVFIAWGIGVACHGFFGVVAPALRESWIRRELAHHTEESDAERAASESRHARSLSELSASIAHEIRNPITAAKSLVQQIAEAPTAAENAEYAAVAVGELDRVERAIAHLLRFAREEPRRVTRIRLAGAIDSALELLAPRIAEHGVRVEKTVAEAGQVDGDEEQIRRVIANIVGNAIDAMVEAKVAAPRIVIEAGRNLAETEAWIRIRDSGPGIPDAAVSKIFTPFYTTKSSGTGLGLPLSRKMIEEHGGTLEARSEAGQGAEFLITLPAKRSEAGS